MFELESRAPRVIALIGYAALIAWLSLREAIPLPPGQWDKLGHFLAYGVFAVLGSSVVAGGRGTLLMGAGIVGYSGLLEIAQSFVPGRDMSALDLLANACGVVLGFAIATRGFRMLRPAGERPRP